ncbi:hypothetical protein ACTJKN_25790 [Pedobacter sp. 22163]|uniref:hypothetical protein n=1 Tax=Pedobacter sp. 22163 TaxID=3453883 RepID=UPI003F87D7A8
MFARKSEIRNPVRMGLLLEFETAFPGEKPLTVGEYLKGGNRETILNVAASFLGFKNQQSKYEDNREFISMCFRAENNELANKVYDRIKELEKKGNRVGIINTYSSLTLFEYFFKAPEEQQTQSEEEFEVNFFKAYLVINSEFTKKQHIAFDSTKDLSKELAFPMMMFCMNYPTSDKTYYDIREIWITQLWKATILFQYLSSDEKTKPLYNAFLEHFAVNDWEEYLKSFLPLTISMMSNHKEGHVDFEVSEGENKDKACAFLDKLIIEAEDELNEFDFLTLRSKPFYKVKDGHYRIIFNLFVVEKIFKGMYFLLREVNKGLPEKAQVKALKSFFGDFFSERILFYDVINTILPKLKIKFSGQDMVAKKIIGGPDYYLRKGSDIMIMESKDFLIPADAKMSFDFERYQDEFEKKLYFEEVNGKEKHVGVMQLIAFIKRLLLKDFGLDNNYNYREVNIFPILIVHDHQYNVPGFNKLIDYWFQAELQELETQGFYVKKVQPLVIISIDSLIYHQIGLAKDIQLNEVLKRYIQHTKREKNLKFRSEEEVKSYTLSKQIAFSTFINEFFQAKGLQEVPPVLEKVAPILFKEKD